MSKPFPQLSDPVYKIEAEIGSGGGGVVYKAWHSRLNKHVVIKELKNASHSNKETQRNEVEALKNVKSAYLPQVYDFLTESEQPATGGAQSTASGEKSATGGERTYTVIEFVEGVSLDKLLERGQKFTQPQIVKWYGQLSEALEAIHKQNICHRDVKPANIMLTPGGDVCLIDFNAALVSGNDVRLISRSLGYASPEQYEIYERFKSAHNAPIRLNSSSVNIASSAATGGITETERISDGAATDTVLTANTQTEPAGSQPAGSQPVGNQSVGSQPASNQTVSTEAEFIGDGETTQLIDSDGELTESFFDDGDTQKTEYIVPSAVDEVDWKRSDIYSLGATMYHLLSGARPPQRASEVVPISRYGNFSEGIVFVIEQSMRLDPSERFPSAGALAEAVRNIHRHDTRWKISQSKRIAAAVILPLAFALFFATALYGRSVMAQEQEEKYYATVLEIENGADPQRAFDAALEIYWDRIDPYYAMARRLWNDGDIDACKDYIEQILGAIAKFQSEPAAARSFGDIYFILGNCYYYQSGEPDYYLAAGNFEIAVRYVDDNPVYFRDYAISLARTGNIASAERVLEKAQALGLETDSLNLANGEIAFAKQDYGNALAYFDGAITQTGDDYLRYRALHTSDEIYKLLGRPQQSVELLRGAISRIPLSRVPEMTERLADAYIKSGDYDNAIVLFEQLLEGGMPQYHLLNGLAIMLHDVGEFDRADSVLARMSELFPNDYRVPMRRAFFEAARQSFVDNENRDYSLAAQYYNAAAQLYNLSVRPGESDPEMQQLEQIIGQLRANLWID